MSPPKSTGALADFSSQLAGAVEAAAKSLVAIHARRRIPSSGIIWRDGVIVSASHTVRRDGEVTISLPTGESMTATVAGRDPATDLVALKVSGAKSQVAAKADADSSRVGSIVLAVGRPGGGRDVTATFGVISAVGEGWRTWQGARIDQVLRLDLAIQDGFSGGALVNASGAVVGVNNSALARGAPLALPAAAVDRVLDELLEHGHVRRAFIGVAVHPVTLGASTVKRHQLPHETALVVMSVGAGTPAETAGLMVGDVLVAANGQSLRRPTDLLDELASAKVGTPFEIKHLRGADMQTVTVIPVHRGAGDARE
jgi:S1-C subfamily serine protease